MALDWTSDERARLEAAVVRFPVESGRCAALARTVYEVARPRDPNAQGLHVRPRGAARFVVPKHEPQPRWGSHTLVQTRAHCVDALTGVDGTAAEAYLAEHWAFPAYLIVESVDVFTVDPGIQEEP